MEPDSHLLWVFSQQFESGILGPVGGYLVDRFGPRITGVFGTVIMTIGLLIFANIDSIGEFFLATMVIALGQGLGASMAFTAPLMSSIHCLLSQRKAEK